MTNAKRTVLSHRRNALRSLTLTPLLMPIVAQSARTQNATTMQTEPAPSAADHHHIMHASIAMLHAQATHWSNGDLGGFCNHYDKDAVFVSPAGLTRGRDAVYARYKAKYLDTGTMGALTFEPLAAQGDDKFASVVVRWTLTYVNKSPASGFSCLGLIGDAGAWKIIHDASM